MKSTKIILILLTASLSGFGQGLSFGVMGGISKDVRFFGSNEWKTGFCAGAELFKGITPRISLGGHLMLHHWKVDVNSLIDLVNEDNVTVTKSSGKASVIEVLPSGRVLFIKQDKVSAGFQLGVGLIYFAGEKGSISYTFQSTYSSGSGTLTLTPSNPYPWMGFGFNIGIPLIIARYVQIMPMYCLYLANGSVPYNHISLNIGINFGSL